MNPTFRIIRPLRLILGTPSALVVVRGLRHAILVAVQVESCIILRLVALREVLQRLRQHSLNLSPFAFVGIQSSRIRQG
jgi:hypothetical protein